MSRTFFLYSRCISLGSMVHAAPRAGAGLGWGLPNRQAEKTKLRQTINRPRATRKAEDCLVEEWRRSGEERKKESVLVPVKDLYKLYGYGRNGRTRTGKEGGNGRKRKRREGRKEGRKKGKEREGRKGEGRRRKEGEGRK